jgi:MFS family permease
MVDMARRTGRIRLPRDARLLLAGQAARAFGYGLGAVLLGRTLATLELGDAQVGLVLAAILAGTAIVSVLVGRFADRLGRRRSYGLLYLLLAVTGVVFAAAGNVWLLVAGGLLGALSSEVIESGPFTSLEQPMLATDLADRHRVHGFGLYNAVAALAGSLGALAAALPSVTRAAWPDAPGDQRWFLIFVPVGLAGILLARRLSGRVEVSPPAAAPDAARSGLGRSRSTVSRLAGLFALDSFAGGIAVSAFVAYWLTSRFDASATVVAATFAAIGLLQTASFLMAPLIADRIGLLRTMVVTHLASNVFLAAVAFAPTLPVAIGLLLIRTCLSQMDVPTRQAYVMALVDPSERTAAAAYTGTVRYLVRPAGPPVAGLAQSVWLGLPFLVAGVLKAGYDLTLWAWFRRVPLPQPHPEPAEESP